MSLTIKEVTKISGKTEQTIYNWIKKGKIQAQKKGKIWKIEESSIESYLSGKSDKKAIEIKDNTIVSKIADEVISKIKPVIQEALVKKDKKEENKEIEKLRKENIELKALVLNLDETVKDLQSKVNSLVLNFDKTVKDLQSKVNSPLDNKPQNKPQEVKNDSKDKSYQKTELVRNKKEKVNVKDGEKWLRDNISIWIDEACKFKKAGNRTWRELGENKGDKISMNGKGFQCPRAYLHAIENWEGCTVTWSRLKARIALEYCKQNKE